MDDSEKMLDEIRDRIFSLLQSGEISQKDFAEAVSISPQTVTDWKKGKSRSYMQKLPLISSVLNSTLDWIYNGIGTKGIEDDREQQSFNHLLEMAYHSRFVGFDGSHIDTIGKDLLGEKKESTPVSESRPPDPLDARLNDLLAQATEETKQAMIALLEQMQKP